MKETEEIKLFKKFRKHFVKLENHSPVLDGRFIVVDMFDLIDDIKRYKENKDEV